MKINEAADDPRFITDAELGERIQERFRTADNPRRELSYVEEIRQACGTLCETPPLMGVDRPDLRRGIRTLSWKLPDDRGKTKTFERFKRYDRNWSRIKMVSRRCTSRRL